MLWTVQKEIKGKRWGKIRKEDEGTKDGTSMKMKEGETERTSSKWRGTEHACQKIKMAITDLDLFPRTTAMRCTSRFF